VPSDEKIPKSIDESDYRPGHIVGEDAGIRNSSNSKSINVRRPSHAIHTNLGNYESSHVRRQSHVAYTNLGNSESKLESRLGARDEKTPKSIITAQPEKERDSKELNEFQELEMDVEPNLVESKMIGIPHHKKNVSHERLFAPENEPNLAIQEKKWQRKSLNSPIFSKKPNPEDPFKKSSHYMTPVDPFKKSPAPFVTNESAFNPLKDSSMVKTPPEERIGRVQIDETFQEVDL